MTSPPASCTRVDIAVGIAQEERHDPQTSGKGLIDSMVLIRSENKIAGKRPVGERCGVTDPISGVISPPQRHAAERARV